MNTFNRIMCHLFTTRAAGRRAFPPHALKSIQTEITEGELRHRAEVRLIVEAAMPLNVVLDGVHSRARAQELFSLYRLWDTEENCGVLVYINLADRKVEIVADRASGRALSAGDWAAVCRTMTEGFARGDFHDSTIAGMKQLNNLLTMHFPAEGSRANQLPDRPLVL